MIAGIYISQEMFENGILTAFKPSLEHDRKHVLRLLSLHGDQALIYSNCKLVYSLYTAFFSEKQYALMSQVLWLSPSPEQARRYVEASERKLLDVSFFGTSSKSREKIEKFQRE